MNKIMFAVTALCASACVAGTSNVAKAPPGTDNISFGYGAGAGTSGANQNVVVIGTDAGLNSANNTNCVFIGASAGSGMSGKSGAVVIGDVLVHTNGVTSIKGFNASVDTSVLLRDVTAEYSTETAYFVGEFCKRDGKLWCCKGDTYGAWDSSKWNDMSLAYNRYSSDNKRLVNLIGNSSIGVTLDTTGDTPVYLLNNNYGIKFPSYNDCVINSDGLGSVEFNRGTIGGIGLGVFNGGGYSGRLVCDEIWCNGDADDIYIDNGSLTLSRVIDTKVGASFAFENGQFCVYTNYYDESIGKYVGVKAGTLTFTPAQ